MEEASTVEEWRPIVGFEDCYEVSNTGQVRRSGKAARQGSGHGGGVRIGRILKQHKNAGGYFLVQLWRSGKYFNRLVHGLVADAFIGPCPEGMEVNHIHGRSAGNGAANLEYMTRPENLIHSYENGFHPSGENHQWATLSDAQVQEIRSQYLPRTRGYGCRVLARKFGVSKTTIQTIVKIKSRKHLMGESHV